jgi:hypothetical protein
LFAPQVAVALSMLPSRSADDRPARQHPHADTSQKLPAGILHFYQIWPADAAPNRDHLPAQIRRISHVKRLATQATVRDERAAVPPVPSSRERASAGASSTRRSLPEVGALAQTRSMTAMLTQPASPTGALTAGPRLQMLGQQAGNLVRGALAATSARSPRRRGVLDSAARLPLAGGGLICGLVYASARGSIRGHWLPLTTQNDWRGRALTVILAPEKRKVGSSILPLTTTLTSADALSVQCRRGV